MTIKRTTRAKAAECYTIAFNLKEALRELMEMVDEDFEEGCYPHLDKKATGAKIWSMKNEATELFFEVSDMGDALKK